MTVLDPIVLGFFARRVAREPAGLAQGVEPVASSGEDLVHVRLMARVPEEDVAGRVEDPVERERELDHAEVGAEVTTGDGCRLHDEAADLGGERAQLVVVETSEVGGPVDRL